MDELFEKNCPGRFQKIWPVIKKLLVLSHGQASVERGFSANKQCNDVNLQKESLVARRIIKDHVKSIGGIANFTVTKGLEKDCSDAYRRYQDSLRLKKILKGESERSIKRKAVQDEVRVLKRMKTEIEDVKNDLQNDSDKCMRNADKEKNKDAKIRLFSKATKLRESALSKANEFEKKLRRLYLRKSPLSRKCKQ